MTLASGARVTLGTDGALTYDPDGRFDALISQERADATGAVATRATDSFSYTLTYDPVDTATVTVTGVESADDRLGGTAGPNVFDLSGGGGDRVDGGESDDVFFFGDAFDGTDAVTGGGGTLDQIGLRGDCSGGVTFGAQATPGIEMVVLLPGTSTAFGAPGTESHDYDLTTVDANVAAGETLIVSANTLASDEVMVFDGSGETDGAFSIYCGNGADMISGRRGAGRTTSPGATAATVRRRIAGSNRVYPWDIARPCPSFMRPPSRGPVRVRGDPAGGVGIFIECFPPTTSTATSSAWTRAASSVRFGTRSTRVIRPEGGDRQAGPEPASPGEIEESSFQGCKIRLTMDLI